MPRASLQDHAGFAVAFSGGVAVIGGIFFALGAAEVGGTKHAVISNGWVRFGLVLSVLGLALLVLAGVLYVWRPRADTSEHRIAQEQFESDGASGELDVSIEDEVWHAFQFKALILEAKIRIHNNAASVKTIRRQASVQIYEQGEAAPGFAFMDDIDVLREVDRLERMRNPWPHIIEPGETITAWYVISTPHRPQGGETGYTIKITDEHRHEYGVTRPGRPK
jgi:hypothetical protein